MKPVSLPTATPRASDDRATVFAPAKLNLFLHIVGRRPDGLHLLESLFVFADIGDRLSLEPAAGVDLVVDGPGAPALAAVGGGGADNLAVRAAELLRERHGRPGDGVRIGLHKLLPVAAGIGGGSADAAATLRGLIDLWGLSVDDPDLDRLALDLGADVPACLSPAPQFVSGIGERRRAVAGPGPLPVVLINPGVAVATGPVFQAWAASGQGFSPELADTDGGGAAPFDDLAWLAGHTHNDLEVAAVARAPEIAQALDGLAGSDGCILARMSGSGATCFGLFDSDGAADHAARRLARTRPSWWVRSGRLLDGSST